MPLLLLTLTDAADMDTDNDTYINTDNDTYTDADTDADAYTDTDTFRLRTIQYGCKLRRGRARVSEMR